MTKLKGLLPCATTHPAPEIECFIPESGYTGTGMVIFPGGGYWQLMDHEGAGYAEYFSAHGIACFVVSYRLAQHGYKHPAMIEDAYSAIYAIRSRAEEFGVDPGKLGVCGSSAGGHLAATAMLHYSRYACEVNLRPDFGVLAYPVIMSSGGFKEKGTIDNLLGEHPAPDLLEMMACEKQVTPETPPCFIWTTAEDTVVPVENSLAFAAALSRNRVPNELRIYDKGKHGLGLDTPYGWEVDVVKWIEGLELSCNIPRGMGTDLG